LLVPFFEWGSLTGSVMSNLSDEHRRSSLVSSASSASPAPLSRETSFVPAVSSAAASDRGLSVNVLAVRKAFMSVFVSLLRGYREFIHVPSPLGAVGQTDEEDVIQEVDIRRKSITTFAAPAATAVAAAATAASSDPLDRSKSVSDHPVPENLFDEDEFLKSAEADYVKFLRVFLGTQLFSSFIDERVTLQDPDWFDLAVMHKMQTVSVNLQYYALKRKYGLLLKEGRKVKSWNQRWFTLEDMQLEYYKPHDRLEPCCSRLRRLRERVHSLQAKLQADADKQQRGSTLMSSNSIAGSSFTASSPEKAHVGSGDTPRPGSSGAVRGFEAVVRIRCIYHALWS
jgi:hypothetical protein